MSLFRHDGTTYRQVIACARGDGTTLRTITGRWIYTGGLWRQYFSSAPPLAVNLTDHSVIAVKQDNDNPPPAHTGGSARIIFEANGLLSWRKTQANRIDLFGDYPGEWLTTGNAADAELFVSAVQTGSGTLTGPTGVWVSLDTVRVYVHNTSGSATGYNTLTCRIRDKNTLVELDVATIILQVT